MKLNQYTKGFSTPESRWARFGPYYAMFPLEFAFEVVDKFSKQGDYILDPFAGRCSSIYAGAVLGRQSLGIEINSLGWLFGSVKINPAKKKLVVERLKDIYVKRNYYHKALSNMHEFYRICYCDEVLKFLISARKNLDWKNNQTDATLTAIIAVYMHGKIGEGLSNQMRLTKSMGMQYSIDWWKKNNLVKPPELNPYDLILKKINWRYMKGMPDLVDSRVVHGDSTIELENIAKNSAKHDIKFSLLFTSPPYQSVTDYHLDQWLRLWLLGESETPIYKRETNKGRFACKEQYYDLLDTVFKHSSKMMDEKSTIYVRTDAREFTLNSTLEILSKHFPNHTCSMQAKPVLKKTQTSLYGDKTIKPGEVDILLTKK